MFKLIGFVVKMAIVAAFAWAVWWQFQTPQPFMWSERLIYAADTAMLEIVKRTDGDTNDTVKKEAANNNVAAQLAYSRYLFQQASKNPVVYKEVLAIVRPLANRGYPLAQNALGVMYRDGLGIPADRLEAYKWFSLAAERQLDLAMDNVQVAARGMNAADVLEGERRADLWRMEKLSGTTGTGK